MLRVPSSINSNEFESLKIQDMTFVAYRNNIYPSRNEIFFEEHAIIYVLEGEKRFELVLRLQENKREQLNDVRNLLIPIEGSQNIPLSHLADVDIKDGPNQIQREDTKRRIVVGFNVRGRDVQSIVKELQGKVEAQIKFPAGYYPTYGGAFENLNEAKNRLMIAVPVSLLLIFILIFDSNHHS